MASRGELWGAGAWECGIGIDVRGARSGDVLDLGTLIFVFVLVEVHLLESVGYQELSGKVPMEYE